MGFSAKVNTLTLDSDINVTEMTLLTFLAPFALTTPYRRHNHDIIPMLQLLGKVNDLIVFHKKAD